MCDRGDTQSTESERGEGGAFVRGKAEGCPRLWKQRSRGKEYTSACTGHTALVKLSCSAPACELGFLAVWAHTPVDEAVSCLCSTSPAQLSNVRH